MTKRSRKHWTEDEDDKLLRVVKKEKKKQNPNSKRMYGWYGVA